MKRNALPLTLLFAFLAACTLLPAQTPTVLTVGTTSYPTIQSAVTTACGVGATGQWQILIPNGTTPADTIAQAKGCARAFISDQRTTPVASCYWLAPSYLCSFGPQPPPPTPSGGGSFSTQDVAISATGCAQGADLATGFKKGTTTPATGGGACLTAYLAAHVNPAANSLLILHQDGVTAVESPITGPPGGWGIVSDLKPSMTFVPITGGTLAGNVLTLNTSIPHGLAAGQGVFLNAFPSSTFLNYANGNPAVIVASVSSSTTFTVAYTHSDATVEAGIVQTASGNGFVALTGNNGDVIRNSATPCPGGSMNQGWTNPGLAPARASNLVFRNLLINGNRGNGTNGNSTNGNPLGIGGFVQLYGPNYCTYADINLLNVSGVDVRGNWLFNAPTYALNLNNVANYTGGGNVFDAVGPGAKPFETNQDGLHINGPGQNFHEDGSTFRTGDDAWAINAPEGYVGPIDGVTITNSYYDGALSAGRMYTGSIAPPAGDTQPTVNNVLIDGAVGTVQFDVMEIGFEGGPTHTLGGTMGGVRVANHNLTVTGAQGNQAGFRLAENAVDLAFDNISIKGVAQGNLPLFNTFLNTGIASLTFSNISLLRTAQGATTGGLLGGTAAGYGRVSVNGFRIVDVDVNNQATQNYGTTPALIKTAAGTQIAALFHGGVDMTNVGALMATPSAALSVVTDGGGASNPTTFPTLAIGPDAGSGAQIAFPSNTLKTDQTFGVYLTTGSNPGASGNNSYLMTATFGTPFSSTAIPNCTLTPTSFPAIPAAAVITQTNQNLVVVRISSALAASTSYSFVVTCPRS